MNWIIIDFLNHHINSLTQVMIYLYTDIETKYVEEVEKEKEEDKEDEDESLDEDDDL